MIGTLSGRTAEIEPTSHLFTLGSNSTSFWELLGTKDQQILILFQELDPNLRNSSVLINSHGITEIPRNEILLIEGQKSNFIIKDAQ